MVPANSVVLGIISVQHCLSEEKNERGKSFTFLECNSANLFNLWFGLEPSLETYVFFKKAKMWRNWLWEYMLSVKKQMGYF